MLLPIKQLRPDLWNLVQQMDAGQRQILIRQAFAAVKATMATIPALVQWTKVVESNTPVSKIMLDELRELADQFEEQASGRYRDEPPETWLDPFRAGRYCQALLACYELTDSEEIVDSVLYELAYAHWPKEDDWLESITFTARQGV